MEKAHLISRWFLSRRWRSGVLLAVTLSSLVPMNGVAGDVSRMSVASLLRDANGSEPAARLSATRELFRRGPAVVPELEHAGAKPMATISPPRGNVIYSLLKGGLSSRNAVPDSFGLHLDANVTVKDVERMGRAHGFRLAPGGQCQPGHSPACYVQLLPGKRLGDVFREILTTEAHVTTVNLNYVLR
jgi:hypothetical protein